MIESTSLATLRRLPALRISGTSAHVPLQVSTTGSVGCSATNLVSARRFRRFSAGVSAHGCTVRASSPSTTQTPTSQVCGPYSRSRAMNDRGMGADEPNKTASDRL